MANPEHLEILKQGVEVWNKWRTEHPEIKPNLEMAVLNEAILDSFILSSTNLRQAQLRDARLQDVKAVSVCVFRINQV